MKSGSADEMMAIDPDTKLATRRLIARLIDRSEKLGARYIDPQTINDMLATNLMGPVPEWFIHCTANWTHPGGTGQ